MRKIEAFKGDDTHVSTLHGAAMANAAASYAMRAGRGDDFVDLSYQVNDGDKRAKHDRRKRLVIAAAFIVAELERLDSAAKVSQQQGTPQAPVAPDSEATGQ